MEGRDAVNQAMIRHWVDAMGDENPVYVDDEAARANGFPGVIAPPTMLQAWIMRGLRGSHELEAARSRRRPSRGDVGPTSVMFALLDEAGFTSVVATNCDQEYVRPLVLGDRLTVSSVIESVSPEKHTGLGDGHFVTTRLDFVAVPDVDGATDPARRAGVRPDRVGRAGRAPCASGSSSPACRARAPARPPPRPARPLTQDNAFFFEGRPARQLLIQRCASCGMLRHPPRPACASCGSFEWDTVESSGRGTSTASWSSTTPRSPPSTTRCPSPWSSSRRGPGSWPTSSASIPTDVQHRHARRGRDGGCRRRADPPDVPCRIGARDGGA